MAITEKDNLPLGNRTPSLDSESVDRVLEQNESNLQLTKSVILHFAALSPPSTHSFNLTKGHG